MKTVKRMMPAGDPLETREIWIKKEDGVAHRPDMILTLREFGFAWEYCSKVIEKARELREELEREGLALAEFVWMENGERRCRLGYAKKDVDLSLEYKAEVASETAQSDDMRRNWAVAEEDKEAAARERAKGKRKRRIDYTAGAVAGTVVGFLLPDLVKMIAACEWGGALVFGSVIALIAIVTVVIWENQ